MGDVDAQEEMERLMKKLEGHADASSLDTLDVIKAAGAAVAQE